MCWPLAWVAKRFRCLAGSMGRLSLNVARRYVFERVMAVLSFLLPLILQLLRQSPLR